MRFREGEHYPHPPRGPGRGLYRMSDAALRARRQNLARSRTRSNRETLVIKLLIWQSGLDDKRAHSQRSLARQLGVSFFARNGAGVFFVNGGGCSDNAPADFQSPGPTFGDSTPITVP